MDNALLTENIGVYFLDMDTAVEEEVHPNEDGSFTIIIYARISQERQTCAYQHALAHIMRDDFSKFNVDEIEKAM
ncbi:hypothetical protein DXB03_09380 [Lachnospiraceae bacterium OF11-28]|jgi:hypothetical protein|nr:hypothetical protein DXB03_09380 [Lachnospiraceae bacterium OF11-28]DAN05294.1 MAG TPA: hypothetical protein [Caudoviricetes sp.]